MTKIDVRDLIAGLLLVTLGTFEALYAAGHYEIGSSRQMGSGYFPFVLGWIVAGLGAIIVLIAMRKTAQRLEFPRVHWRAFIGTLTAIMAFSLLVESLGLIAATLALTLLAALAQRPYNLRRTLMLGFGLALLAWLIFAVGLQMNLPAFALAW